jgi:Ca2+-binding EF-hand superfamily protein
MLYNYDTKQWLKRRYSEKASERYLLSEMESKRSLEMIELFKNFDFDNSGKLDFEEMKQLFEENDMPIDELSLR